MILITLTGVTYFQLSIIKWIMVTSSTLLAIFTEIYKYGVCFSLVFAGSFEASLVLTICFQIFRCAQCISYGILQKLIICVDFFCIFACSWFVSHYISNANIPQPTIRFNFGSYRNMRKSWLIIWPTYQSKTNKNDHRTSVKMTYRNRFPNCLYLAIFYRRKYFAWPAAVVAYPRYTYQ